MIVVSEPLAPKRWSSALEHLGDGGGYGNLSFEATTRFLACSCGVERRLPAESLMSGILELRDVA